ncbi:TPA: hypothetical protein ACYRSU_005590, partial [Klebsiella michiganensis]
MAASAPASVVILTLLVIGRYYALKWSLQDYPMNSVLPSISPQVSALAPGFRALSIDVVSAAVRAP